jgi:hypothetical protein
VKTCPPSPLYTRTHTGTERHDQDSRARPHHTSVLPTTSHSTTQHHTAPHNITQRHTASHGITQHHRASHSTATHRTIPKTSHVHPLSIAEHSGNITPITLISPTTFNMRRRSRRCTQHSDSFIQHSASTTQHTLVALAPHGMPLW